MRRLTAVAALATLLCDLGNLGAATEKRIDLAAIISKKDAEAALGEAVQDPQPRNGEGADGYYSRCNYYSENPGRSLVLRVRQASAGQLTPANQLEELTAGNARIKPLSGLGEKAALSSEDAEKGRVLMLYVVKGNAFVTVGIGGLSDEKINPGKGQEGSSQNSGEALGDDTGFRHFVMVANVNGPQFSGGANIAIKCPSHTYEQTLAFYRDTLGLPLIEEENDGCIFQFGPNRLWIDRVPNLSHPDIWLELETNDTEAAASYLKINGVPRRDEVEQLREDFDGFWISDPAGVIHLVVGDEE